MSLFERRDEVLSEKGSEIRGLIKKIKVLTK